MAAGRGHRTALKDLLNKKERVGDLFNNLRLARQRALGGSTTVHGGGDGSSQGGEQGGGGAPLPQPLEGVHGGSVQREGPVARSRGSEAVINEMLAQLIIVMEVGVHISTGATSSLTLCLPPASDLNVPHLTCVFIKLVLITVSPLSSPPPPGAGRADRADG